MDNDIKYMRRAIELAKLGEGLTRPNPPVGAVLVQGDKIIAEGWHKKAGGPHAEVDCLQSVEGDFDNATLYVTLEPCSTHGRTPPCTELILDKGIGRVVVSVVDLNPEHVGRGLELLRKAGVEVITGICELEGRHLIAPFEKFITTGMPYVTLKLASTLDGKIADSEGNSKWITGPEARDVVQIMRRRADAIMVGGATVIADNPSLLPRPGEGRTPYRVIIGKSIPSNSTVLTDEAAGQTIVRAGALDEILKELARDHGIMHVFCEGGGRLAAGLIEAGLVDEYMFFIAPKLLGTDGVPNFSKTKGLMDTMEELTFQSIEMIGNDVLIRGRKER